MSFCRFSSMNWMCDVYVYEDVSGGFTTHVARNRRIFPPIPDIPITSLPRLGGKWDNEARMSVYPSRWRKVVATAFLRFWTFWHGRVHMASLDLIPSRTIGLPHDGETYSDESPGECADTLLMLRAAGYNVPQYAVDALRAEQAELEEHKPW